MCKLSVLFDESKALSATLLTTIIFQSLATFLTVKKYDNPKGINSVQSSLNPYSCW